MIAKTQTEPLIILAITRIRIEDCFIMHTGERL